MKINILGVEYSISATNDKFLYFFNAFKDAYDDEVLEIPDKRIKIQIQLGEIGKLNNGEKRCVHFSKTMPYWNFDSYNTTSGIQNKSYWESKGVLIEYNNTFEFINVTADNNLDNLLIGETVYHLCRNLALYLRNFKNGNLFHASAVVKNNEAILFTGSATAGKTTLMIESLLHQNAKPLSNDRVLISADLHPTIHSWPGYVSFCEGTLLNYSILESAVEKYESDNYAYRTQSWKSPLRPIFSKEVNSKRIFPMQWLTSTLDNKYKAKAPLKAIVISKVSPDIKSFSIENIDFNNIDNKNQVIELFKEQVFDGYESAFLPWHNLKLSPELSPSIENLVDRIIESKIPVVKYETSTNNLDSLGTLLDTIQLCLSK